MAELAGGKSDCSLLNSDLDLLSCQLLVTRHTLIERELGNNFVVMNDLEDHPGLSFLTTGSPEFLAIPGTLHIPGYLGPNDIEII